MRILLSITLIILLSLTSYQIQSNHSSNLTENEIIGEWIIENIYLVGKDITKKQSAEKRRWINISGDGHFKSGGQNIDISHGKWIFDDKNSTLHMVTFDNEQSNWKIQANSEQLEWNGLGNKGQQDFKFVLKKKGWTNP